jgi:hypothetical protein
VNEDLTFDTDALGRLVANPPHKRRALTTLCFAPDGVIASAGSASPVLLDWNAYGHVGSVLDGTPDQDGWIIGDWAGSGIGVAVRVSGCYEQSASEVVSATLSVWRRFESGMPGLWTGRSLPVLIGHTLFTASAPEYAVLAALCTAVHDNLRLRTKLGDLDRMRHLARDLNIKRPTLRVPPTGLDRDSVDIHAALIALGFTHRYTRPLTTIGLPTTAEVTDRVVDALDANPHRGGRAIDREQIERIVSRDYVDVEPWPFAALAEG